jgi:hypothetical protein
MRTAIVLLTVMGAFLVGSAVALAAVISCPTGPGGECRGTNKVDQITGTIGADQIYAWAATTRCKAATALNLSKATSALTS